MQNTIITLLYYEINMHAEKIKLQLAMVSISIILMYFI